MGLYTHNNAVSFIATGLSIILYGTLFGFVKRDPTSLRVGLEACMRKGVKFIGCIKTLEKEERHSVFFVSHCMLCSCAGDTSYTHVYFLLLLLPKY